METKAVRPSICDARTCLPVELARTAVAWAQRPGRDPAEIRDVRCTLEFHTSGDHYAHVIDMASSTAGWTRWPQGGDAEILLVLPDCPATSPDEDACSEYEGHAGGHTWQVNDPWNPSLHPEDELADGHPDWSQHDDGVE